MTSCRLSLWPQHNNYPHQNYLHQKQGFNKEILRDKQVANI